MSGVKCSICGREWPLAEYVPIHVCDSGNTDGRIAALEARIAALEAERDEAELSGARIVLDVIDDTGFFGIAGEYGSAEKRDAVIRAALAKRRDG